jgi:hypothetical protein
MSLPRFNAEACLGVPSRFAGSTAAADLTAQVLPQQAIGDPCTAACIAQFVGCLTASPWMLSLGCTALLGLCLRNCSPPPACRYVGNCPSGSDGDFCINALCGNCPPGLHNCLTDCGWFSCDVYCCPPSISTPPG